MIIQQVHKHISKLILEQSQELLAYFLFQGDLVQDVTIVRNVSLVTLADFQNSTGNQSLCKNISGESRGANIDLILIHTAKEVCRNRLGVRRHNGSIVLSQRIFRK